jgi:hypothetical protein
LLQIQKQQYKNNYQKKTIIMSFAQGFEQSNATQRLIAFWTHAIDKLLMSSEIVPEPRASSLDAKRRAPQRSTRSVGRPKGAREASGAPKGHELHIPFNVMVKTGSNTTEQYCGAVRSGFHMVIQSLPSDVRPVIEDYLQSRLIKSRNRLPEEVVDADIIFGTGEPVA